MSEFTCASYDTSLLPDEFTTKWQSPSNIALVKYWGKKGLQTPINPSISFTLNKCHTNTRMTFRKAERMSFSLYFEGSPAPQFEPKIKAFIDNIIQYAPYLGAYQITIDTQNSFPHSSGIASSASAFSALALCICTLEQELGLLQENDFYRKASFLARLGSGSACRSVFGGTVMWGEYEGLAGSDEYGINLNEVHDVFASYQDTILIVEEGQKSVSSSAGHTLIQNHPFAQQRVDEANKNTGKMLQALKSGNLKQFISITEAEALMLHALMLTSDPYFILMKPNTLAIINEIRSFRETKGIPVCFTLDAGANVHMLYPEDVNKEVLRFTEEILIDFCQNHRYICDRVGEGPHKIG